MATRPIADGLFEESTPPRLIGGRHRATGKYVFPFPAGIEQSEYEAVALSPNGRIWSYTIQRFRPKSPPYAGPEAFEAYAVGYVELPGEVIVEGRLTGRAHEDWRIGQPVRTTVVPFRTDPDGTTITVYAFAPLEDVA
jgi:uncharacterized OB-fold protein